MRPLPPLGGGGGGDKNRNKPQPLPEFQPNQELMSPDDSATLMEVKHMLRTLTTALATITTQVEQLCQGKASQVAPMSAQPWTRAGGNPPAISSQVALMSAQPGTRLGATHSYPVVDGPHVSPTWGQGWGQLHWCC